MIKLEVGTRSVGMVDQDGDELRIELVEDGRVYVTAAQEDCMATVGPFTKDELAALVEVAETTGAARW